MVEQAAFGAKPAPLNPARSSSEASPVHHKWLIRIFGQVQAVGLRAFIAAQARGGNLTGWAAYEDEAVLIHIQGPQADLMSFLHCLRAEAPPAAVISRIQVDGQGLAVPEPPAFYIAPDRRRLPAIPSAAIPDRALCANCRSALFQAVRQPKPHISNGCDSCGPRIGSAPTTPLEIWLTGPAGQTLAAGWDAAVARAAAMLTAGGLVALPGWGECYLAGRADRSAAICRLRQAAGQPHTPLLLLARDLPQAAAAAEVTPLATALLLAETAPAVRLRQRPLADHCLAHLTPDGSTLDVLLPYHPALLLLMNQLDAPLALAPLPPAAVVPADAYLLTNEPVAESLPTSLVQIVQLADEPQAQWLRRGRGFLPPLNPVADPAVYPAHAAVAAVQDEYELDRPVLGLVFDSAQPGPDGQFWGGDLLAADRRGFVRTVQLEYVPRPPADFSPAAAAAVYLDTLLPEIDPRRLLPGLTAADYSEVGDWLRDSESAAQTSAVGDLCLALVGLLDLADVITYPAQALAILAHQASHSQVDSFYDTYLSAGELRLTPLLAQILLDQEMGAATADIARRCLNTLANLALRACQTIPAGRLDHVVLAGSAWREPALLAPTVAGLQAAGYHVFWPSIVPAGDEAIVYGSQIVAAARRAENEFA